MSAPLIVDGGNAGSTYPAAPLSPNPGPIFAPNISTYAARTPYITPTEYTAAGTGVDVGQLVPGGTTAANQAALLRVIARASSWADNLCYQVLAATLDTQSGRYRIKADGSLAIPVDNTPLIAVNSVSTGPTPATLTAMTDLSGLWLGKKVVTIPYAGLSTGLRTYYPAASSGWMYAAVGYVNGWANTVLTAASGAASLLVQSGLGIYPGMTLTVADGANTETVTVAGTYTPGSTTVPTAAALLFTHPVGTAVSAFPESIKQAVISLTSALIKTRGSEAVVMMSMTAEPSKTTLSESGGIEDFEIASDLLTPFRRVW